MLALAGAAAAIEHVGVMPRTLAPYIEKRSSGHNPAIVAAGPDRAPDIVAPNVAELQYTTGMSIRSAVEAGDLVPAIAAVMDLRERGIPTVLATLGARGAIFASGYASLSSVCARMMRRASRLQSHRPR